MSISSSPISSRPVSALTAPQGDLSAVASVTLDDVTVSSVSDIDIAAAASVTLDDVTLSSAATVSISATETTTLDDATVSATAALLVQASSSVTLDDATVSADADLEIHADASITLDDVSISATGTFVTYGLVDVTLDDVAVFSDGNIRLPNTDADGDIPKNWKRPPKLKFGKKQQAIDLDSAIVKAVTPVIRSEYTPTEWVSLFNALAGPAPDYTKPLTVQIAMNRMEEEDIELLLLSI